VSNKIKAIDICMLGQVRRGDFLLIQEKNGQSFPATVKDVLRPGSVREEIIFATVKNKYFITSMYLKGESWVQDVVIIQDCKATCIINNFMEHH